MNKKFALIRSLSLWLPRASGSTYVHVGHVGFEFLIKEIIDTRHFNLANSVFRASVQLVRLSYQHGSLSRCI